ncbi:MAG: TatD family hydrolase [Tepidisphaeraceae bacterium]|jgi:TatD DNase family protein
MIDTHCHLTDPGLIVQLDDVMARAELAGVDRMVTIGTAAPDWQECLEIARRYPNVRCALGVHPNYCNEVEVGEIEGLKPLLANPSVVAVGEMGLDYHYDSVPKARQQDFFSAQLNIAVRTNRPVVIHSRKAIDDCLSVLKDFPVPAAVFHCFTGTADEARRILDAGWLIGFTGVVTFKKTDELRQVAAFAPADRILVETDAPYLSPEPKRGQKINEPSLVVHTAAAVAKARGVTLDEIDRITSDNARQFYRWD